MSFLNPISVDVKVYKSTDKHAPVINHADRRAGDVKTVLKACLVTGYGDKEGAGWLIEGETDVQASFYVDNAELTNYRLILDDSGANVSFNISHHGTLKNPNYRQHARTQSRTARALSWIVLACEYGFYYIECHEAGGVVFAGLTYFGRVKSGLVNDTEKNIVFINTMAGNDYSGSFSYPLHRAYIELSDLTGLFATGAGFVSDSQRKELSVMSITTPLFVMKEATVVGQLVGIEYQSCPVVGEVYGIDIDEADGKLCLGIAKNLHQSREQNYYKVLLDMQQWEF